MGNAYYFNWGLDSSSSFGFGFGDISTTNFAVITGYTNVYPTSTLS